MCLFFNNVLFLLFSWMFFENAQVGGRGAHPFSATAGCGEPRRSTSLSLLAERVPLVADQWGSGAWRNPWNVRHDISRHWILWWTNNWKFNIFNCVAGSCLCFFSIFWLKDIEMMNQSHVVQSKNLLKQHCLPQAQERLWGSAEGVGSSRSSSRNHPKTYMFLLLFNGIVHLLHLDPFLNIKYNVCFLYSVFRCWSSYSEFNRSKFWGDHNPVFESTSIKKQNLYLWNIDIIYMWARSISWRLLKPSSFSHGNLNHQLMLQNLCVLLFLFHTRHIDMACQVWLPAWLIYSGNVWFWSWRASLSVTQRRCLLRWSSRCGARELL